jgi:protein required for attachment to host cells
MLSLAKMSTMQAVGTGGGRGGLKRKHMSSAQDQNEKDRKRAAWEVKESKWRKLFEETPLFVLASPYSSNDSSSSSVSSSTKLSSEQDEEENIENKDSGGGSMMEIEEKDEEEMMNGDPEKSDSGSVDANSVKELNTSNNAWTQKEHELLKEKTKQFNAGPISRNAFYTIAKSFPDRDANACFTYYDSHLKQRKRETQGVRRTAIELKDEAVEIAQPISEGSSTLLVFTAHQTNNDSSSNLEKKGGSSRKDYEWSQGEHDLLKEKTKHFDVEHIPLKEFDSIAEFLPKRTAGACFLRYNIHLKKKSKKGRQEKKGTAEWSQDEHDLLKEKTTHFDGGHAAHNKFKEIAEFFPNRTAGACKKYYENNLRTNWRTKEATRKLVAIPYNAQFSPSSIVPPSTLSAEDQAETLHEHEVVIPIISHDTDSSEDEEEAVAAGVSRPSDMAQTCTTTSSSIDYAEEMWV